MALQYGHVAANRGEVDVEVAGKARNGALAVNDEEPEDLLGGQRPGVGYICRLKTTDGSQGGLWGGFPKEGVSRGWRGHPGIDESLCYIMYMGKWIRWM